MRQRGKDLEKPAKHPVDPKTVLEDSAKDQPGQKGKQEVWVGQGDAGEVSELQQGKQEAEGKDPENPAKQLVDTKTVLAGSALSTARAEREAGGRSGPG